LINTSIRTLLLILFCLLSVSLFAQEDFSAEIVNQKDQGKDTRAKIYVTREKMRFESNEQNGRFAGAMIVDLATQMNHILIPERKMYMEFPQGRGPGAQRTLTFFRTRDIENACSDWLKLSTNQGGTCQKVGTDTVSGRSTVKYEGTNSKGETGYVWLDRKIAFPIKWQGKNDGGELQNIKEGSQPASLFEIPSDYQKMQLPAGIPNMPPH
jgi:hypothetical protein